jgi:ubiquinone/menaquinone biosynthesis C-methylase UbiE
MSEDEYETILCKRDYDREQKLVDERFNAESAFWRDAYRRRDVFGLTLRMRQHITLDYVEELSLPKSARTLEIGCGAGFMAVALARRGFAVEAVDHAPVMVELTQRHAKQKGLDDRINTTIEDVHKLTFEDCSFDLIIALGVIAWLHDLKKALVEISRVLIPGGHFVLSLDNPYRAWIDPPLLLQGIVKHELERDGLRNPLNGAHAHFYSIKEFKQYLHDADLTVTKNTNIGFGPFTLFNHSIFSDRIGIKIHQKLQQCADSGYPVLRMLGSQYVVLAVKRK